MIGRDRQTLADAAVALSGSMEGVFRLSRKNGIPISDGINGLELEETGVIDINAHDYIANGKHFPATESILSQEDEFVTGPQGELILATNNETIEL